MADTPVTTDPTIVNTPLPAAAPTPEAKLFPNTPGDASPAPAPVPAAEKPPVAPEPPPAPVTDTKPPTEPDKSAAPAAPKPVPTENDLKIPENSPLGTEDLASIKKDYVDGKITKDQAEGAIQSRTEGALALKATQDKAFEQTKAAWKDAVAKDPELGGDKLPETIALSSRAFKAVASPELQRITESTGLGNHPEFVRMMAKIGRIIGEDRLIRGDVGAAPAPRAPEEVLYGKTTPNK